MTAPEFIRLNFQRLKATGLSRRAVYENLKLSGLELGSFEAFSKCWSRNEAINASPSLKPQEEVMQRKESEREVKQEVKPEIKASDEPKKKTNPALRPIYVNGVEVQIDPETGAKRFEIKSAKNK